MSDLQKPGHQGQDVTSTPNLPVVCTTTGVVALQDDQLASMMAGEGKQLLFFVISSENLNRALAGHTGVAIADAGISARDFLRQNDKVALAFAFDTNTRKVTESTYIPTRELRPALLTSLARTKIRLHADSLNWQPPSTAVAPR